MKQKVFYVTYLFINYSCIIDTCEHSLLFDEISGEKKYLLTFLATNIDNICIDNIDQK